jgi:hypothetical protein
MFLVRPGTHPPGQHLDRAPDEITGHRKSAMRTSIVTLDHRCQTLADVTVEGIDFVPFALDSTEKA